MKDIHNHVGDCFTDYIQPNFVFVLFFFLTQETNIEVIHMIK